MKKLLPLFLCLTMPAFSAVVIPHSPDASTTPEKPKEMPHPVAPPRPKLVIAPSSKMEREPMAPTGDLFYYPGVIAARDGRWMGGDNFVNLSKSIPVQVNFIQSEGVEVTFSKEMFQSKVSQLFEKGGISPMSISNPPLPFFNLVIMIFPTADGLAAACQGRLFEKVNLDRVRFKDEVFQAITWEQTNLVFGPTEDFERMLTSTVEAIANNFTSRVNAQGAPAPQR